MNDNVCIFLFSAANIQKKLKNSAVRHILMVGKLGYYLMCSAKLVNIHALCVAYIWNNICFFVPK